MIIILASGYFYIFQDYISSLSFWEHSPFECPWTYMLGLLGFLDVPCRYFTFSLIFFMFLFNFVLYIKIFFFSFHLLGHKCIMSCFCPQMLCFCAAHEYSYAFSCFICHFSCSAVLFHSFYLFYSSALAASLMTFHHLLALAHLGYIWLLLYVVW